MSEHNKHAADYIAHTKLLQKARETARATGKPIPTSILLAEGLNAKYILETNDPTPDAWIPWAETNGYLNEDGTITQKGYNKIMEPLP